MVRVVPSVIASAPRRVFGSATSVKIGRPIVHQPSPPLEQVRPRVGEETPSNPAIFVAPLPPLGGPHALAVP